jgi:hypothetical protein
MSHAIRTFDLKTAAGMFGMGHIEFYKMLRGESQTTPLIPGWIHAGTFRGDDAKNSPKEWARKAGYLTTEQRQRPAPYDSRIALLYQVTVMTRHGIIAMELILNKKAVMPPIPLELTEQNAAQIQHTERSPADSKEREKCLQELAEMGIPIGKAS